MAEPGPIGRERLLRIKFDTGYGRSGYVAWMLAATTRPASPHYADQVPLFVAKRFKPVWFTRADVASHAVRRETVSN